MIELNINILNDALYLKNRLIISEIEQLSIKQPTISYMHLNGIITSMILYLVKIVACYFLLQRLKRICSLQNWDKLRGTFRNKSSVLAKEYRKGCLATATMVMATDIICDNSVQQWRIPNIYYCFLWALDIMIIVVVVVILLTSK